MNSIERTSFRLSGPSIALDGRTHAVRGDLADIALAEKIFVPHYARPMEMTCIVDETSLLASSEPGSEPIGTLAKGDAFMAIDLAGGWAWGFKVDDHLVGYVDLAALEQVK